ncbi:T9SS type A sorting domain-containing protein [Halpernia sp.]|uniref:T9SS type A sorting domain-containing protein n=1 Tax=Halpernia sp. TaxID=2782209 RepID=UPI003A912309
MKKLYSFLLSIAIISISFAQVQTEVLSPGVYKITYGATNDYTTYDPGFGVPTFYVHVFISAADNSQNVAYNDAWTNSTVTMNFDSGVGAYVGTIDLNTKLFTNTNNTVPQGTTVNKVGMVFKDLQNGATKQSADLSINLTTILSGLAVNDLQNAKKNSFVADGKLYTKLSGNLDVTVYDMGGKIVEKSQVKSSDFGLELNVPQRGNYIVKISNGSQTETVKFIK